MGERIWAPWRMEYIRAPKKAEVGCALCHYVGRAPARESGILARWAQSYVVLNKYPYAAGHLMVVPNAHVERLEDLADGAYQEMFELVRRSTSCLEAATGARAMNIGLNLGAAAGAGIDQHLHVHVVPRWAGDNNFMPVLADVRVLPEYLERTWDRLAPAFALLEEEPR